MSSIELKNDLYRLVNADEPDEQMIAEQLVEINREFEHSSPEEVLQWAWSQFGNGMVLGTGFGPSGVWLIDRLSRMKLPVTVFYLDTQLLFRETYKLRDDLESRYDLSIVRVTPELSVEEQAEQFGDELWNRNPNRCCFVRKVLPLRNYLRDKSAWITGVRRSQSSSRRDTPLFEWDPANGVVKINPLVNWSREQIWQEITYLDIPYNPLHDEGFPSIGCIPCTQPADVKDEEEERAGRWKNLDKTECGIHISSQKFRNGSGSA
ncbi:MAG: phosphoadenylyl-sulfate reductase [Balneolaceae bacterium]